MQTPTSQSCVTLGNPVVHKMHACTISMAIDVVAVQHQSQFSQVNLDFTCRSHDSTELLLRGEFFSSFSISALMFS